MKIIIAIDSFKGSLTSIEAGEAVQKAIAQLLPDAETEIIPIADGGEGTLAVITHAIQGQAQFLEAHNPCMEPISTSYILSSDQQTAFIEMANISGLPLIKDYQRNPMKTTTYGVGELIQDALEKGCTQFILGIGGSATNDAGVGALQALGFRFLDKEGNILGQGGEILSQIHSIDRRKIHPLLKNVHFIVACDVRNPFYGLEGAAYIFARQKGADDCMIEQLDQGMRSFAKVIELETGKDISHLPGSGAAGGMGGGFMAFLDAELRSGADLLLDLCQFREKAKDADLIITGEGRMDRQSLMGKITGKILEKGKAYGIPVIALAGCVEDEALLKEAGFHGVYATKPNDMPLEEAMKREVAIRCIKKTVLSIVIQSGA